MSSTATRTSSCLDSSPSSHSDGGGKYVSNKKKVRMTDERDQDRDRDQESGKQRTVSTISTDLPPARPSRFYLLYPVLTFMVERCVVRMNSLLMKYMNQSDLGGYELERQIFLVGVLHSACLECDLSVTKMVVEWIGKWAKSELFQQLGQEERIGGSLMTAVEIANVIVSDEEWYGTLVKSVNSSQSSSMSSDSYSSSRNVSVNIPRKCGRSTRSDSCRSGISVGISDWYVLLMQYLKQNGLDDLFGGISQCPSEWTTESHLPTAPYCMKCEMYIDLNRSKSRCCRCNGRPHQNIMDYRSITTLIVVSMIIYHFYRSHVRRHNLHPGPIETLLAFKLGAGSSIDSADNGSDTSTSSGSGSFNAGSSLETELDYQFHLSDAEYRVSDLLRIVRLARPYQCLSVLKRQAFEQQCYYVTHVILSYTDWGRQPSLLQSLYKLDFQPEADFLLTNMDVVIKEMKDVELVAEFASCLCILRRLVTDEARGTELRDVALIGMQWVMREECRVKTQVEAIAVWPCCRTEPFKHDLEKQLHVVYTVLMAASLLREAVPLE